MKVILFLLATVLGVVGSYSRVEALTSQFVFNVPSGRISLSTLAYQPIPRLDSYDYPYQGVYHYYSIPGITGETNYNPFSYTIGTRNESETVFDFPEMGNFVY